MASSDSPTAFADLHPHIIQTHILPCLDGRSLASAAYTSSSLRSLCTQDKLWSDICKSTWPSTDDPRVDDVISTFPAGHRSLFGDSFPALITHDNHLTRRRLWSRWQTDQFPTSPQDRPPHPTTSDQLISAVDIHYQNDLVYSGLQFTDTTVSEFLSTPLWIEFNDGLDRNWSGPTSKPGISRVIDLKLDDLMGPDEDMLCRLKETVRLNWVLIDPTRKRAGNLSSVKPVLVRKNWNTNEIQLRYVTVLPGCDPNEMVQCRIEVTCVFGKGGAGVHVREVILKVQDLERRCLTGEEFMVIAQRAIMEENNVRRKMVDEEEKERKYKQFLEMRREGKKKKKEDSKMELVCKVILIVGLMSFTLWV